jgi:hypothetical protein
VQKKESGGSTCADHLQDYGIGDEIRKNHQGKAAKHDLPQIHALAVNETTKPIGPKNEIADQVCGACFEHAAVATAHSLPAVARRRADEEHFRPRQSATATDKIDIET